AADRKDKICSSRAHENHRKISFERAYLHIIGYIGEGPGIAFAWPTLRKRRNTTNVDFFRSIVCHIAPENDELCSPVRQFRRAGRLKRNGNGHQSIGNFDRKRGELYEMAVVCSIDPVSGWYWEVRRQC